MQRVQQHVRRTAVLLVVGAALLVALVAGSTILAFRGEATFDAVLEERELRRTAVDLLSALQDAEVGHRGYILTRDPAFLDPYTQSLARLPDLRGELARRIEANPGERVAVMAELEPLIAVRLDSIAETIAGAEAGTIERDEAIAREREGKAAMDGIRALLDALIGRSDARLADAVAAQRRLNGWAETASILAGLAALAVVGTAFVTLVRQLLAIRAQDVELQRLNAGLEERVQARTQDLIRANQEVQRFAYIVTHDLRAPLVNIMGFTSELDVSLKAIQATVLAEGEPSEAEVAEARRAAGEDLPEAIAFIRASTRKMDGLINAILKISRDGRRELRAETVDLRALSEQALGAVAHQIAETGGEATVDAQVAAVVSDRLSIEQALGNLVDNAVKYAQPGRPLHLAIRIRPDGPRAVRIEVEDNGRGIAEADRDRVFELFRRAGKQDKAGEGIGLAHVRSLVRNLGGEITLRSREGEGSVFAIELPADLRQVREAGRG